LDNYVGNWLFRIFDFIGNKISEINDEKLT